MDLIDFPCIFTLINMKILVTGGDGKFAQKLKNENPDLYLTPGKNELNIIDPMSIKNYGSVVSEVDGIILNANMGAPEPQDWFDDGQVKPFRDMFDFYVVSTTRLIEQYAPNLKFVIGLTTGMVARKDRIGHSYPYIFGKELLTNHIFRLSCQDKYKHIKMFNINPGPMMDDEGYEYHSKLMYDVVHNLEKYEDGELYSIRGGDKF